MIRCPRLTFVLMILAAFSSARADFAIHDGDTVVFLGDSITAARTYGKIIENFTLLRYPDRKVHFINAGIGGDTAAGGLKRLDRDVFSRGATLVTVAFGINDIGWGGKADDAHRKLYLDSIRQIVQQCKDHHVRVFICSAAATASDPDKSQGDFLQKMCDEGMAISRSMGEGAIDVLGTLRKIQRKIKDANAKETDPKKKETLHLSDGIHLNELGQTAMAYAILKGLDAPAEVSEATIDAGNATVISADKCQISHVAAKAGGVEFDRLDQGLPFNQGLFFGLQYRFVPIPNELNRYMLSVKHLKPGKYDIRANQRNLGIFTAEQLSAGVNIASATADVWEPGGPWDAAAWSLNFLTEARNQNAEVKKSADRYLSGNPGEPAVLKDVTHINDEIERVQRTVAKPQVYHFEIIPPADVH